jgi:hypothetical protein
MPEVTMVNRGVFSYALVLSVSAALSLTVVPALSARPFRIAKLPDKGKNFGCATCHVNPNGGGKRNPFGRDYEKFGIAAGDMYSDHLAGLDSDGDGFTNDEEFAAGTNPGDDKSKPAGHDQKK